MGLQLSCVRGLNEAANEFSTELLLWGKLLPRHPCQWASPWDWSWAIVGTICVFTAQNCEILWDLRWTSVSSNWLLEKSCLLTGLILLRGSKYHHTICLCSAQSNMSCGGFVCFAAGVAASRGTSWSICIMLTAQSRALDSLPVRENKSGRNTPAHVVFHFSF